MARTHSESTNINPVRSSILPGGKKNQTFVRPDDDVGDDDDDDDDDVDDNNGDDYFFFIER